MAFAIEVSSMWLGQLVLLGLVNICAWFDQLVIGPSSALKEHLLVKEAFFTTSSRSSDLADGLRASSNIHFCLISNNLRKHSCIKKIVLVLSTRTIKKFLKFHSIVSRSFFGFLSFLSF